MKRWSLLPTASFLIANLVFSTGAVTLFDAQAQTPAPARRFPPDAVRGTLRVTTPPEVLIDGHPARLSPGARIFGTNNALVFSATLIGQDQVVHYRRDAMGQVRDAWILSADEVRLSAGAERNFSFASDAAPPARDDGKTPFDQLPKYPAR